MAELIKMTIGNMKEMTRELQKKYNQYATVQTHAWNHRDGDGELEFWMAIGNEIHGKRYDFWLDLVADYNILMKHREGKEILFRKFK